MKYTFIKIWMVILLVITTNGLCAQVLYEISGKSASAPSYILATNRLATIQFLDSIPNLFKCYARSNKVITEMVLNDSEALLALRQAALLDDSVRLGNFYSDEEYSRIDIALRTRLSMSLEQIGRMKPAYLTEMYRNELFKTWLGFDENTSMESFFEAVAVEQDKPIIGLDDVGETMYMLFNREPIYWQYKELLKVVDFPEREIRQEKLLLNHYRMGRLTEMVYQVCMPDNQTSISYSDYQVYAKRNHVWVKRLAPYLALGSCFITLNAIYLGGDEGLLALLKADGYKVKPVNKKQIK